MGERAGSGIHGGGAGRRGVWPDIRTFLLRRPGIETFVDTPTRAARDEYNQRIAQRVGIDVTGYSVLNIHRVGIDAPVDVVFEQLRHWDGASVYWPNHLATVEHVDAERRHIKILALGQLTRRLRRPRGALPADYGCLFEMTADRVQEHPEPGARDDARYVLYSCAGGYPIGVFGMFVRSASAALGEVESSQLFFMVSFNFYGRKHWWPGRSLIGRTWEAIHNRATSNILVRFKEQCEAR